MTPARARAMLGLPADADAAAVRRAYADRLRAIDPDADPAGFAALRDARDTALAAIRRQATPVEEDPFAATEPVESTPPAEWPHAAPRLEFPEAPTIGAQSPQPSDTPLFTALGHPASAPSDAPLTIDHWPFAIPRVGHLSPQDAEILSDQGRWAALDSLLTGADLAIPLSDEETARAEGHLAAVLRLIDALPIGHSAEAEEALAQMLARAWPRSAPLLESAASAFGWESERGQLNERPAIAFLNARLRGLRFYENVQKRDHRYHRAWVELTKPGARRNRLIRTADVTNLLAGIRKNFAEVEHYLNADRVAAWDRKIESAKAGGVGWPTTLRFAWVALLLVFYIARTFNDVTSSPHPIAPPTLGPPTSVALDAATANWFGPHTTMDRLRQDAPWLAAMIRHNAGDTEDADVAEHAVRDAVLLMLHAEVLPGGRDRLREVQTLRLAVLDASARISPQACLDFLTSDKTDATLPFPPEQRDHAAKLIRIMIDVGTFREKPTDTEAKANIPGKLIDRIATSTRLTQSQVIDAIHRKGSISAQCSVHRSLIQAALNLPGKAGDDILRIE